MGADNGYQSFFGITRSVVELILFRIHPLGLLEANFRRGVGGGSKDPILQSDGLLLGLEGLGARGGNKRIRDATGGMNRRIREMDDIVLLAGAVANDCPGD